MDGKPNETSGDKSVVPAKDMSVASELVRARKVLGWTQNELAQQSGISRDTLKQYETGRHMPGAREIRLLSKALQISPNRLLFGRDEFEEQPSIFAGLMEAGVASEAEKFMQFMVLFQLLLPVERGAMLTLMEPILVGRLGVDEVKRAMSALGVIATHAAPVITELAGGLERDLEKRFDKETMAAIGEEIDKKAKEIK